eukprot:gb/GECG01001070.1/.p1 GENE.gb/GECG01001070.1/~~gb/GECG01001070.1/.p1  ORF type:complete len:536 (+),score=55.17 gb/GECG01001070.1/:1-1608(+)
MGLSRGGSFTVSSVVDGIYHMCCSYYHTQNERKEETIMSLNTDEINLLVYKYLEEAGYSHSAFCFGHESLLTRSSITHSNAQEVPPGALVSLLQKASMFMEIERELETTHRVSQQGNAAAAASNDDTDKRMQDGTQDAPESIVDLLRMQAKGDTLEKDNEWTVATVSSHKSEIHALCWNPTRADNSRFLSCGADSLSRVWKLTRSGKIELLLDIDHTKHHLSDQPIQITCGTWHPEGSLIVTGLSDGHVCMWDTDGELLFARHHHTKRVHGVRWNPSGRMLCSFSEDGSCIWYESEELRMVYRSNQHIGPIMDAAWRDDYIMASASSDANIVLYGLTGQPVDDEDDTPANHCGSVLKVLTGHRDEVNALRWDFAGNNLISCSDDLTTRIWNIDVTHHTSDGSEQWTANASTKFILSDHSKEVSCIAVTPELTLVHRIASGSYDGTICVWDTQVGKRLRKFSGEIGPVSSIDISPDGSTLACGCLDHVVAFWNLHDGSLTLKKVFDAPVMDVRWDNTGTRLIASLNSGVVKVFTAP